MQKEYYKGSMGLVLRGGFELRYFGKPAFVLPQLQLPDQLERRLRFPVCSLGFFYTLDFYPVRSHIFEAMSCHKELCERWRLLTGFTLLHFWVFMGCGAKPRERDFTKR